MTDEPYDYWKARACGLLYTLDIVGADKFAATVGMPVEVILGAEPILDRG